MIDQLIKAAIFLCLFCFIMFIRENQKEKNKTITQKWKEGLIGPNTNAGNIRIPPSSCYQPTINLPPGVEEIGRPPRQ